MNIKNPKRITHIITTALTLTTLLITPSWAKEYTVYSHSCDNQPQMHRSRPDSRYQILNDHEVKDLQTGLIWQRCALGQKWDAQNKTCDTKVPTLSWQQALQQAHDLGNGYRLPTVKELYSLVDRGCSATINKTAFPNTSYWGAYWSSTPVATATTQGANNTPATQAYAITFSEQSYSGYGRGYIEKTGTRKMDVNVARAVRSE